MRALHDRVASGDAPDTWLVVEHEPTITLGRNALPENVLATSEDLAALGIDVAKVERGGDATYHGPGQLVLYPVMRLERFRAVAPFVSSLERATIATLASFEIAAHVRREHRGVYVGDRAIAAIGLAVKRMTTMHGIALNVATDLVYDRYITPCGTPEFGITSMSRELGRAVALDEVLPRLLDEIETAFELRFARGRVPD